MSMIAKISNAMTNGTAKVVALAAGLVAPALAMAQTAGGQSVVARMAEKNGVHIDPNANMTTLAAEGEQFADNFFKLAAAVVLVVGFVMAAVSVFGIYSKSKQQQPAGGAWIGLALGIVMGALSLFYLAVVMRASNAVAR